MHMKSEFSMIYVHFLEIEFLKIVFFIFFEVNFSSLNHSSNTIFQDIHYLYACFPFSILCNHRRTFDILEQYCQMLEHYYQNHY